MKSEIWWKEKKIKKRITDVKLSWKGLSTGCTRNNILNIKYNYTFDGVAESSVFNREIFKTMDIEIEVNEYVSRLKCINFIYPTDMVPSIVSRALRRAWRPTRLVDKRSNMSCYPTRTPIPSPCIRIDKPPRSHSSYHCLDPLRHKSQI